MSRESLDFSPRNKFQIFIIDERVFADESVTRNGRISDYYSGPKLFHVPFRLGALVLRVRNKLYFSCIPMKPNTVSFFYRLTGPVN